MDIQTKTSLAKQTAARWRHQYLCSWINDSKLVYEELLALGDNPTAQQVEEVVGNDSWTRNLCSECQTDVETAVNVYDHDDMVTVCTDCLRKAIILTEDP